MTVCEGGGVQFYACRREHINEMLKGGESPPPPWSISEILLVLFIL